MHRAMDEIKKVLLCLVRIGIGKEDQYTLPVVVNWENLFELSLEQGVAELVLDGINRCFVKGVNLNIDFLLKMDWIGEGTQMEHRYQQYEEIIGQLGAFYQKHGIRMMILKGYGLSQNYPIPSHRPCGDIDIYLFGEQERADSLLQDELGIEIDKSHHHHTVFQFQGETVENHYDFLNVHVRKSNRRIEAKLKELAHTDITETTEKILFPSVEFNAIYLLRHCAAHFASTEMSVRQALDWGFFMEKHHEEINWDEYLPYIKKEGMIRFYNLLGAFCVNYLGFNASIFHELFSDNLLDRFSNEIMEPEFKDYENGNLLWSLWVKPRRWWHNRWKNRLCYQESAWEEFAYGLWAKVLKPSHFIQ